MNCRNKDSLKMAFTLNTISVIGYCLFGCLILREIEAQSDFRSSPRRVSRLSVIYVIIVFFDCFFFFFSAFYFIVIIQLFIIFILSHNKPCFLCNTAITNFLVSNTCEIRFHDVIGQSTVPMYSSA